MNDIAKLLMIKDGGKSLELDNTLLVTDTIDIDMSAREEELAKRFPLKLSAACMVIVFKGSLKWSVNLRDYIVNESECILITEGTIVENLTCETGSQVIFLVFSQAMLSELSPSIQDNYRRLCTRQVVVSELPRQHLEMTQSVYQMLRTIMSDAVFAANRLAAAFSCLALMLNIIMQEAESEQKPANKTTRQDEIVARFLQCVATNYRTHRELGYYAHELGLSLKYMSHVIYEQTGRHPSQWIKDHVILDAKTMLRSGRYSVQQVAEELNFPNQSFFGKYFKEAVGVSPKKWK